MKRAAFVFLIFIIILSFSLRAYSLIEPINEVEPVDIMVEIEEGMSGRAIANLLEEEGAIKSSTIFYLLLRFKQIDNLKSGYYRFSTSDTPLEIIEKLQKGEEESFKVTIPEGFTLEQILNRFAALTMPEFDKELLHDYINKYVLELEMNRDFSQIKLNEERIVFAEGFVIPDTYNFPMSFDEEKVARDLIQYFDEERLPKLKEAAAESEFSAYELLIIASLIEEEGKVAAETEVIASVIYNRLKDEMPLQLDATIQYAMEERTERVLYDDLEIDSPYNTYQISALPPTPIASPGQIAVEAAINPAETDYLFYFALEDGSHVFTRSYQEHLQKQRELN